MLEEQLNSNINYMYVKDLQDRYREGKYSSRGGISSEGGNLRAPLCCGENEIENEMSGSVSHKGEVRSLEPTALAEVGYILNSRLVLPSSGHHTAGRIDANKLEFPCPRNLLLEEEMAEGTIITKRNCQRRDLSPREGFKICHVTLQERL